MRLNQAAVDRESYSGRSYIDGDGQQQWPSCTIWDEELPGFGMRIHPPPTRGASRKDFVFTYNVRGRARVMVIGTYGDCTLKEARRAANEALTLSRRGVDPIEARATAAGVGTVEDLAQRFLDAHTAKGPNKNVPGGS